MKPGIHSGIPNKDYHADKDSYSSSFIKLLHTPALAKNYMDNPPESKDVYRIGNAIHKYILEFPEFEDDFFTGIDCARRSLVDKHEWEIFFDSKGANGAEIIKLKSADWYAEFEKQTGKSVLTPDELQMIKDMAESVKSNEESMRLLTYGKSEQSIYWTDEETGLNLRVRPDYLNKGSISDLKSVKSAYAPFFAKSAYDFGYHISQAMYQDGVMQTTGEYLPFKFICVEKTKPYLCAVHSFNEESEAEAHRQYREYLKKLQACLMFDEWEGYDNCDDLSLPAYGFKG